MRRTKKLLAFVLAGAMIASNVAYASPAGDAENANTEVVDTLSLNPNENAGGVETSGSTEAADPGTGGNVEATEPAQSEPAAEPEQTAPATEPAQTAPAAEPAQTEPATEPEQTAPTLYEVTFESPEKHGDILTMDDAVVKAGETLEADENGKVQFKVKADTGYRVEKVVNTANGNELELVENLYYELQINENTTIQVHYQKVPAEEDADSDDQEDDSTAAEESADEETAKAEMPEQTLETTASDGAVITITAPEGALPEGAQVSAKPVESVSVEKAVEKALETEEKELQDYKAYDITIQDKDGNEIQPEKEIQVNIAGVEVAGEETDVFHIPDGSAKAEKVANTVSGDVAIFSTESFSIYAVAGSANHGNGAGQSGNTAYTMWIGQTLTVEEQDKAADGTWDVEEGLDVVEITKTTAGQNANWRGEGRVNPTAKIKALKEGKAVVTYTTDRWSTSYFYITVERQDECAITFLPNGGSGQEYTMTTSETNISLPTIDEVGFTYAGKTFIGWSTDNTGKGDTFIPGVQYPDNSDHDATISGNVNLYAIWLDENASSSDITAYFYIRGDKQVVWEPAGYDTASYYPQGDYYRSLTGKIKQPIAINNNPEAVQANILQAPTDTAIKNLLAKYGVQYDPGTQYIKWYVIKYTSDNWHVDGTIFDIEKYEVEYNPNNGTSNVPPTAQYSEKDTVNVNFDTVPTRAGYTFLGWSEDKNATEATYSKGGTTSFEMPGRDVTLYAVWQEKDSVTIYYKAVGGGSVSPESERLNPETGTAQGSTATANPGYKFIGWYDNESFTGEALSTDLDFVPTKDKEESWENGKTYYAKFEQKTGVAGYNLGGGQWVNGIPSGLSDNSSGESPKYPYTINFEYGDTFTVISDIPVKEGSVFLGWYQKKAGPNQSEVVWSGDTVTYPYENPNRYTLDALWADLTVSGETCIYDGSTHSVTDEITFNNSLPDEFKQEVEKLITKGTTSYRYSQDGVQWSDWSENNPSFIDVGNYTVQVKQEVTVGGEPKEITGEGTIIINKRNVTLTSATDSKEYDGTALTNDEVTVGEDGFADGEGATYTVTGSQTLVGRSANTFTYELNERTKADNYNITKSEGTLTVTDRDAKYEITVEAKSDTAKYDGTEHSVSGFEALSFDVEGQTYKVEGLSASVSGTDADTYTSEVSGTAVVKDAAGNDVTAQFTVKTENGTLTIEKRNVTLTSATDEKEYDGTALTNDEVTVGGDGFAEDEGATYAVTGSQTLVGSSANAFTYELKEGTKAANYNITKSEGTLTVKERTEKYEITVKANSDTAKYDGTEKSVRGLVTDTFVVNGQTYKVEGLSASVSGTDADTYTSEVSGTAVVKDAAGNNVTAQFTVKTENGTLTIEKRNVTLTSATDEKEYDGTALTNDEVTVGGDGFAEDEGATYNVTGSQTLVGSSANAFTYELKEGTKAGNYNITKSEGTLTVTDRDAKYEITVKANSDTAKYDGTEHSVSGFEALSFDVEGQTYKVEGLSASVSGTDADTYTSEVTGTAVVKDAAGNDVTAQFTVKTENGELTIEKRNVTLTSATDEKQYDGTALTNEEVTVGGDEFAEGEGATYTVTGSQTLVGSSTNMFTYELKEGTKAANYNITKSEGTLTVKDRTEKYEITVTAKSDTAKYDGTKKSVSGLVTDTFVVEGQTYKVEGLSASVSGTDADTYTSEVSGTAVVKDAAGNDVTAQFTVKTENGELTIEKRNVTLTSATDEKQYDGTALTNEEVTVGGDEFAEGEGATYTVTGSQTLVGSSANTFTYELKEGTKADNYNITTSEGILTIKEDGIEPLNPDNVIIKTHDGRSYDLNEQVEFTIRVTNIYDEPQTIIITELPGVTITGESKFDNVGAGQTVQTTAVYQITEQDILNGHFENHVTAEFSRGSSYENTDDVILNDPNGHVTIDKKATSTPANGSAYGLGEKITYEITATNDGNLTLTNVEVTDDLTGESWPIESLAPGASETFTTSYTVTEEDILAGSVVNEATATATSPDPDKPEAGVTPDEEEVPTATPAPSIFVKKEAAADADGVYNLGDEITYTITVTNNGNVTVDGIEVADDLTGDSWQDITLAPGETWSQTAVYKVTEKDIINGSITNVATAEGKDPNGNPVMEKAEETVETDPSAPHLTIVKTTTSKPANGETYALGETITYEITATNDGNLTLKDAVVKDDLTGDEWTIESLAPGASKTFNASYTVTEADIHNGKVVNEATATAESDDPDNDPVVVPGTTEDKTDAENPDLGIEKEIINSKAEYQIGDTIEYQIKVTNTGNVTQKDIVVEDQLNAAGDIVITDVKGADGKINGAEVTLDTLAPGKAATISCEYTVLKADRGNTITNVAIADDDDGEDPVTPEVPAEVEEVYDINVTHVFADGEEGNVTLPADYVIENLEPGTSKDFTAEEVEGYTAYPAQQSVTVEDGDVTVVFTYYRDVIGTNPQNPDSSDGVPDIYQARVTYVAVNGVVSFQKAVVTLFDANGQPAENGTGHLTAAQIPTATAWIGYNQASATWGANGTPTTAVAITGDITFTVTFAANPATPVPTPGTPLTPQTPAGTGTLTPGTTAATTAAVTTVEEEATPLGDYELGELDDDVATIDEDDTPLGNLDLDNDHACCILHFLLLLLALIIELIYTHNRKKGQERIFELRRQLAENEMMNQDSQA